MVRAVHHEALRRPAAAIVFSAAAALVAICCLMVLSNAHSNIVFHNKQQTSLEQQKLWENYFPGYKAIRARYERTKLLYNAHMKRMGAPQVQKGEELHSKSIANPYIFCKRSFPPVSDYDQAEFHSCLDALGVKRINLQNVGDSQVATDITGAPAGYHQHDGPNSLSPGSDGWSRW
ncbi:hypothetical protein GUITHDRAFT_153779 [Guillardia theta CCMP2712]|uniref:Uncharacterized protein n=1 Tax=Guillardia theta (strain CCMP2712) TaxID=905079 RepID=L1J0E9_GUITC|nr:hypothetical protein GUITHDRAFT_153779 [Guillardia theta CCMP2712]EKX41570.1 hypothetical protein GUITHDRAFT_153779 [Guillardia theta CCMP2712]|mmetsp:Transcript_51129/g.159730  ORF Transcript_51129/g.159730 Transcript_51129/m.159730 type:complete len:176 (-) Transcript_51129:58-585(-)|eukprot:XP_005828550.1 hypothetical protein GUITHDRAFT_153779 [Guillardia theta CCMP2712]